MTRKILIVEGNTAVASVLSQALEQRGFAAEVLQDARDCVERVRQWRPDLVVLSVDLPEGQNGYLLCGKLKKDDALGHIPIIIMGNPDGFEMHRRLKARADEYLAVPVDANALADLAKTLTQREGTPRAQPEARQSENAGPPWALVFLAVAVAVVAGAWLMLR